MEKYQKYKNKYLDLQHGGLTGASSIMNIKKSEHYFSFIYKRDLEKNIIITPPREQQFEIGDTLEFRGDLYVDGIFCDPQVAAVTIKYEIRLVSLQGVAMTVTAHLDFNKNCPGGEGTLILQGNTFSPKFRIINGRLQSYVTEPNYLMIIKGTGSYQHSFGVCQYVINGPGVGKFSFDIEIIREKRHDEIMNEKKQQEKQQEKQQDKQLERQQERQQEKQPERQQDRQQDRQQERQQEIQQDRQQDRQQESSSVKN